MTGTGDDTADRLAFGPFTLSVTQRLLAKEGIPVELGARAIDLLITLASAPNKLMSKQDLISRVWPDVIVEEGSLRFHMTGLRKALGDGQDGARYITTIAGRGYCFVAPITPRRAPGANAAVGPAATLARAVRLVPDPTHASGRRPGTADAVDFFS